MQEHNVLLTYEAIYDIADTEEYISYKFGDTRADKYHTDIYKEILNFKDFCSYSSSGFYYRGYEIFKKPFPPAIIFGTVIENNVHILRVTRAEYDWQRYFKNNQNYEYHYPKTSVFLSC